MAEPARKVVRFAQTAIEARRMWIAPRPADLMATHAEGLPRAAVAARARERVEAGRLPMGIRGARRARPARRMRVPTNRILARNSQPRVAVDAKELAVTDDALRRVGDRLLVVNRDEVRAVHRIAQRRIKTKS